MVLLFSKAYIYKKTHFISLTSLGFYCFFFHGSKQALYLTKCDCDTWRSHSLASKVSLVDGSGARRAAGSGGVAAPIW